MFHPGGKNEISLESPEAELALAGSDIPAEGLEEDEDEDGAADPAPGVYPDRGSVSSSPVFSPGRGQASCGRGGEWTSVSPCPKTAPRARISQGGEGLWGETDPPPPRDPHPSRRQELAPAGALLPWGGLRTFSEVKNTSSSVRPRQCRWALNSSICSLVTLGVRADGEMGR